MADAPNPSATTAASNGNSQPSQPKTNGQSKSTKSQQPPAQNGAETPNKKPTKTRSDDLKKIMKPSLSKKGPPGGFDDTPLPDAPQGYTVRFTFHGAANLPPSDFDTASSDPFLTATLRASNPKRHKEDPDLVHRTKTARRTMEPEWEDEWVVANVPPSGFTIKCRLYDEDSTNKNDRLGNVTIKIPRVYEQWEGIPPPGKEFDAKKRVISKRAYFIKGVASILNSNVHMTPRLRISMEVIGLSDPPHAQMYTVSPTTWTKHFSPVIGRLAGVKVNADEEDDSKAEKSEAEGKNKTQKYDFQAIEMQLAGPVPPKLYHRYVEFKPVIGSMFSSKGLRGKILNKALHKQHARIYNYDHTTESDNFEPQTKDAALMFLKLAHFDEGGRLFTYVLTLDGLFRFTETGKEFGIDLLSKHTMHSDVQTYIACSGEFFIRRLQHADASDDIHPNEKTHPSENISGGPPKKEPPLNPSYYQLVIDNDSGTYRPDKSTLPLLKEFFETNFPGLGIVTMDCGDDELQKLKKKQQSMKKKEGRMMNVVMNRSQSSISSAESDLEARDDGWEQGQKSKREAAYAAIENPGDKAKLKEAVETVIDHKKGESSK